ncbi:MAG: motility associated factor glycosyltransferase family protein [Clostridiales bacterium]|nr:motility associated factor glycosyltransferase family protein [Clostridiales bacterium]
MFYKTNELFLKKNAPVLRAALYSEALLPVKIVEELDRSNFLINYSNKSCYANSINHKTEEFEEMFCDIDKNCETIILVGIGNGDVINYIANNFKKIDSIFIVEPFLDIFKRLLRNADFKDIFRKLGSVTFVTNMSEVESVNSIMRDFAHKLDKVEIVCLASYFSLLGDWFERFKERLLIDLRVEMGRHLTIHKSRYKWIRNSIFNLRELNIQQNELKEYINGKPAIIVSAGPSLTKHLKQLKQLKKKAIIIAAGSAMKILENANIKPHFQMAIDADDVESLYDEKFFENSTDIPLIYANQLASTILPRYNGSKIFMMLPTDVIGKFIYNELNIKYDYVNSGASVVHSTLDFLYQSKCKPIIFLGQDMCFYDNQLYAEGRSDNLENYKETSRIKLKDIYNKEVYTIRNYLQIKYDYEKMIKNFDRTVLINATEGGLGIDGVVNRTLDDVMENELRDDIEFDIKKIMNTLITQSKIHSEDIERCMNIIKTQLNEIQEENNERLELIKKITKARAEGCSLDKLWKMLVFIDKESSSKIMSIPFYKEVIKRFISVEAMSISKRYSKESNINIERIKNGEKFFYNISSEVDIMCEVMLDWIDEVFFGKEEDEIEK